jgi:hypothetical protein
MNINKKNTKSMDTEKMTPEEIIKQLREALVEIHDVIEPLDELDEASITLEEGLKRDEALTDINGIVEQALAAVEQEEKR